MTAHELAQAGVVLWHPLQKVLVNQGFGPSTNAIAQKFYTDLKMQGHNGIDYYAVTGTPVHAMIRGRVTWVDDRDPGYGYNIFMETEPIKVGEKRVKLEIVYGHLQKMFVKIGDFVEYGQRIAFSDNTGRYTTGPHLHIGVRPRIEIRTAPGIFDIDANNGYKGYFDPQPLFKSDLFPVEQRYGQLRTWATFLREQSFAFSPYIRRKIGRAPSNLEIAALAYGYWDFASVFEQPNIYWMYETKPAYQRRTAAVV